MTDKYYTDSNEKSHPNTPAFRRQLEQIWKPQFRDLEREYALCPVALPLMHIAGFGTKKL